MQILHEDYSDGTSRFRYFLESNGERFELHFRAGAPTHLLTGAPVRVKGLRANHEIAVDSADCGRPDSLWTDLGHGVAVGGVRHFRRAEGRSDAGQLQ